ncbi:MAG: hypothetical protein ABGW77_05025 [Campylobacterales bacterium]
MAKGRRSRNSWERMVRDIENLIIRFFGGVGGIGGIYIGAKFYFSHLSEAKGFGEIWLNLFLYLSIPTGVGFIGGLLVGKWIGGKVAELIKQREGESNSPRSKKSPTGTTSSIKRGSSKTASQRRRSSPLSQKGKKERRDPNSKIAKSN